MTAQGRRQHGGNSSVAARHSATAAAQRLSFFVSFWHRCVIVGRGEEDGVSGGNFTAMVALEYRMRETGGIFGERQYCFSECQFLYQARDILDIFVKLQHYSSHDIFVHGSLLV